MHRQEWQEVGSIVVLRTTRLEISVVEEHLDGSVRVRVGRRDGGQDGLIGRVVEGAPEGVYVIDVRAKD